MGDTEKISFSLPRKLLERIEEYRVRKRVKGRIPSRSKVIVSLIEKGLSVCKEDCNDAVAKDREADEL